MTIFKCAEKNYIHNLRFYNLKHKAIKCGDFEARESDLIKSNNDADENNADYSQSSNDITKKLDNNL